MRGRLRAWMDRHRFTTQVFIAMLVVSPGYFRLEQLVHDQQTQAADNKVAGCVNQNEVFAKINGLILASATPRNGVKRTPAEQAAAVKALQPFLIPVRNCTPAGIAKYYSIKEAGN